MKQGRIPDRVHVVREPEDDYSGESALSVSLPPAIAQNGRAATDIVQTLAQISDRLKRSEAERYELLAELREYRKSLGELEDKAEKTEKAYVSLENKIKTRDVAETEITQRQARFERALKDAESKLVQAAAGQNILDNRINDMESLHTNVNQRLDETVVQQARLDRQMEKIGQDKLRTLRKVERMEEILNETQDTLKARALVLLTDQNTQGGGAGYPQIGSYSERQNIEDAASPWWRRSVRMQNVGLASMVVAALLFGWAINQMQRPDIPQIALLDNGSLAKLNKEENRWEPLSTQTAQTQETSSNVPAAVNADETALATEPPLTATLASETPAETQSDGDSATSAPSEQTPAAQAALNSSDEKLMAALEESPDTLAAQLNEIAPEARKELDTVTPSTQAAPAKEYDPMAVFGAEAFLQDKNLAAKIAAEKGTAPLSSRIKADAALPSAAKALETQAFAGVPEAQHDLAAIYTAGRGGVPQSFERASLWFREAADNNVANAIYNLGVLYHQGLGVEKDMSRALYWYREAAKNGHPEAQYNLGIAYIEGIGTTYNAPLAAAFFESAANKGVIEAAYNLGLINENGLVGGVPKPEEALMWYKIAADGGNADAASALEQLASSMSIDMDKVSEMAERMQSVYLSSKGRRAGMDKAAAPAG